MNQTEHGGGPSAFAGPLFDRGFKDVSVLDTSPAALQRCRERLGNRADQVTWLETDITRFVPTRRYDLWHDRAVFHFLTDAADRQAYLTAMSHGLKPGGYAVIAAFAPEGPTHCSGLEIVRWSPEGLAEAFAGTLSLIDSFHETHETPWGKPQAFVYSLFRRTIESEGT